MGGPGMWRWELRVPVGVPRLGSLWLQVSSLAFTFQSHAAMQADNAVSNRKTLALLAVTHVPKGC